MNDPSKGSPITITREELHRRAWETPPYELAREFGITQRRLLEIFSELAVPYPRRLYWRRKKAGEPVVALELTKPAQDTPRYILIEPTLVQLAPHPSPSRWHPLIESWHKERERLKSQRTYYGSKIEWTAIQLRQHRILDMIFKAVERDGFVPRDRHHSKGILFQYKAIEVICGFREKNRRLREQKASGDTAFILKPTGNLIFTIENCPDSDICSEWLETSDKRIEAMVSDIISSILRAGPTLFRRWQEEQEKILRNLQAREERKIEAAKKRTDRNRWGAFIEYAHRLVIVDQVEKFIAHLEHRTTDLSTIIDGRPISDWLQWARIHLEAFDPRVLTTEAVFAEIAGHRDGPPPEFDDQF